MRADALDPPIIIRLYNRMSTGAAIMDSARACVRLRPGRHGICQFGEAARRLDRLLRRASRGSSATRSLDHGIIVPSGTHLLWPPAGHLFDHAGTLIGAVLARRLTVRSKIHSGPAIARQVRSKPEPMKHGSTSGAVTAGGPIEPIRARAQRRNRQTFASRAVARGVASTG
jgi:hypothetical protein